MSERARKEKYYSWPKLRWETSVFYKKTTRHLHTYYKYVYIISEPVHHTKHTQHVVHTMASVFLDIYSRVKCAIDFFQSYACTFLYTIFTGLFTKYIYVQQYKELWTIKRNEADFPMKIDALYQYMLYCNCMLSLSREYEHQTYFFGFLSLPSPNLCLCYICSMLTTLHYSLKSTFFPWIHPHIQTTGKFPFHAAIHATQTISLKNYPKKKRKFAITFFSLLSSRESLPLSLSHR